MLCIEIKWWDPATIVQFFLPAFSSYSQPGMLRKAIAKLVSCGMESLIGNRTNFLHGCPQRRESPNSTLAFPSDGVKKRREPGETIASISHTWMKQREFFFCCTARRGGVWLAFRLCSISLWERGLLQSLLSYGACYWQRFQLTLAENKSIPLNNIIHFPCLLFPLSVPHPEHMCSWHWVNTVTSSEYA